MVECDDSNHTKQAAVTLSGADTAAIRCCLEVSTYYSTQKYAVREIWPKHQKQLQLKAGNTCLISSTVKETTSSMSMVQFAVGVCFAFAALYRLGASVLETLAALLRDTSRGLPDGIP